METIVTGVLVIGAGGSAARAAVEAAGSAIKVDLVNKGKFGKSGTSTPCLQGLASLINKEDDPERFFTDWLRSSGNICDQNLAWEAIIQSRKAVENLEAIGVEFLTNLDGSRQFYRGAGHSIARGMTAKFHSPDGPNTVTFLRAEAEKRGVAVHEGIMITKLLFNNDRIVGAVGINSKREIFIFNAKAVILAAGGSNNIFPNTATEAAKFEFRTTGDSFRLAFDAGVPLIDLEFTQFRESPPGAAKFGGRYLNSLGERFMEKYDSRNLEKAPRAKVVASIYREMMEGRGPIKWEVAGIPEEESKSVKWVKKAIEQKWMPVGIDFQRILGGARINEKAETNIPGLFAAGESSGGVQGAGRMQGAAFLETQVFGTIAGKNAALLANNSKSSGVNTTQIRDEEKRISNISGVISPATVKQDVRKTMWEKVGVVRNKEDLKKALVTFAQLRHEDIPNLSGNDIFSALETANLLFAAEIITTSALEREESRGAHNRSDYPQQDDQKWSKHVCITDSAGNINVSTVPVVTLKI